MVRFLGACIANQLASELLFCAPCRDACALSIGRTNSGTNPFVSHAFLHALEGSGSVGEGTGWLSQHVLAKDARTGELLGAAPAYIKLNSYGEYVFDQSWAQAYARAGGKYYPKLQLAVPFSPVTGPRLLVRETAPDGIAAALAEGVKAVAGELNVSSAHITFPTRAEAAALASDGEWMLRTGMQYHWQNQDYRTFADFEAALEQKRRKAVRQERKKAKHGLNIRRLRGADIKPHHWDAFYDFYQDTVDRKWGQSYLTKDFFHQLGETQADNCMLVIAEEAEPGGGATVAGALNLAGSRALFGRNWGCRGDYPCLHFELCYYQAIEEAIACGLQRVEAGAQGEHKMQRGYLPTLTYSAHYVRNEQFRRAVGDFLARERTEMAQLVQTLSAEASPYKDGCSPAKGDSVRSVD